MNIEANKPQIPQGAIKAFQGVKWAVWQWQQELNDGSTETFEMLERADSATAIAVHNGKIALLTEIQTPSKEPFFFFP